MAGISFAEQGIEINPNPPHFSVKEAVFPFNKFPDADPILGPEMKSTGEVMGTGATFAEAYAKAQLASGVLLPWRGVAFLSVRDRDKPAAIELGKSLAARGFEIVATGGTANALVAGGVRCRRVNKVREGRPHIVDMIKNQEVSLIVNTTEGKQAIRESHSIRAEAVHHKVTYYTTISAARATCDALDHLDNVKVHRLQELHASPNA
jgi:carbamoyl-phosphate synthase large subunit